MLKKDGRVEVEDLSKVSLKSLAEDDKVLYVEAPKKLKPLDDVSFNSSYALWGNGNQGIYVNSNNFFGYIRGGIVNAQGCTLQGSYFYCNSPANINVLSNGDFRLILGGQFLQASQINGGNAKYLVGTKATASSKTGAGVIVGVIDTGINFCHPAFRKPNGTTRILYFKSYNGIELNAFQINQKIQGSNCNYDEGGHGTAVAGVAGGYWSSTRYNSQAKDVEFIIYQTELTTVDLIIGLEYIKQKARDLGKPAVVNISLGGHDDPHDGKSPFDGAIDQRVGEGFIIVAAAGNEGDKRIHTRVESSSADVGMVYGGGMFYVKGWYDGGSSYRIGVCNNFSCVFASPGEDISGSIGTNCVVRIINDNIVRPYNGDKEVIIRGLCSISPLTLKVERVSGSGKIDLWMVEDGEFTSHSIPDGFGGYMLTVGTPATASMVITVGAIGGDPGNSRFDNYGKIAFFSSRGPTRDGRLKPEIVASGFFVCTPNAHYNPYTDPNLCGQGGYYSPKAGTSFSAPVVSALVAMYLQNNPNATPQEIKNLLISNAVYDVEGSAPNVAYGYGKAVWSDNLPSDNLPIPTIPSSSFGGGGGCSMGVQNPINALLWLLLPLYMLARRCRRA
ncbi:MAG: S8 family serine peptidase [Aquificaceae bacterium]